MVYIHSRILLNYEKRSNFDFAATWMDLEGIMLTEVSRK